MEGIKSLYKIFMTHNRAWPVNELICFGIILLAVIFFMKIAVGHRWIRKFQALSGVVLVVFLGMVFASTVFTRKTGVREYELIPFWSWYQVIFKGQKELIPEIFLNLFLLMPMGILFPFLCGRKIKVIHALSVGIFVSAVIEIGQLVLKRGLFEWDDMIHNGLGCMLGCLLSNWLWKKIGSKF